jgi:phenylalanyl-tRNA synthetase beta chain
MLGLGRAISFNLNQKQEYVFLFEIGNIFQAGAEAQEKLALGLALSGTRSFFTGQGRIKDETSLLNLKGAFETIFERWGIIDYGFISRDDYAVDICIHQDKIGSLLKLNPQALNSLGIKNRDVFLGEIYLDKLFSFAQLNKKFVPFPKYPGITRDISFVLKDGFSVKEILILLREEARPLLSEVRVADYYKGKQIPEGFRGLTLSCFYASGERTLTEKEIQPTHELLCALLSRKFEAKLR